MGIICLEIITHQTVFWLFLHLLPPLIFAKTLWGRHCSIGCIDEVSKVKGKTFSSGGAWVWPRPFESKAHTQTGKAKHKEILH